MGTNKDGLYTNCELRRSTLSVIEQAQTAHRSIISAMSSRAVKRPVNTCLFTEGEPARPIAVVDGWVSLQRTLTDGRRQIFSIALPGDIIKLSQKDEPACFEAVCLTPVAICDASQLLSEANPSNCEASQLAEAISFSETLFKSMMLDHIMRLGRLTSFERVGHFLLEIEYRLAFAGLSFDRTFTLPVTQEVLADHLGLSIVHINRTLQQLKRDDLIERQGNIVTLTDWRGLAEICHFSRQALNGSGSPKPQRLAIWG